LLLSVIKALGALYLWFSMPLFWRYRSSDSGRKWTPVIFKQWSDAPMVVRLRGIAQPFGTAVARGGGVVLALHTSLLMAYSVAPMLFVMRTSRDKSP